MLFRKKIARSCSYCEYATKLDENRMLCIKRGVVPVYNSCRKFIYDPCKRIPPRGKNIDFSKYSEEDFKL